MKNIITILVLVMSTTAFAQRGGKMAERIKAQKVAFITEKLSLTPEEAQGFWPIYNAFENSVERIKSEELRPIKVEIRKGDISEMRAKELLETLTAAETKMHQLKIDLAKDLEKAISPLKIIKLKAAEDEFNRKLLERLKEFRDKRNRRD